MPSIQPRFITGVLGVPDYTALQLREPRSRVALVIPVINEGVRISGQLERIRAESPDVDVIIADGGSTDGSTEPEELTKFGVNTLLQKTGPGRLSAQLRMAFHHSLRDCSYDAVITMDGNGKDGVEGIDKVLKALREGADFVQGSRFITGGNAENTPVSRLLAIRLIHAPLTSLGAGHWFTDSTNGFRGHSRRLLLDPRLSIFREVFDAYELLAYLPIRASRLGFKVLEVPVSRTYPNDQEIPTKIRGTLSHLKLVRVLLSAILGSFDPKP